VAATIADFVLTAGEASPTRGVKPGPFGQRPWHRTDQVPVAADPNVVYDVVASAAAEMSAATASGCDR
jgi:hypothetical protein